MNAKEILWRLEQKKSQHREKVRFANSDMDITSSLFYEEISHLSFDAGRLGLNFKNKKFGVRTDIHLLGRYDYGIYKQDWHAGFQTGNKWSRKFSYSLPYKQCDHIGDARTNWELNRHFQFALLAKNFYATSDLKYYRELQALFDSWRRENPFLKGISWTSVMEVAIRAINWMYTLAFLSQSKNVDKDFKIRLSVGIRNMIGYVSQHYSRFSSANNHLLVEATAIGLAGLAFHCEKWKTLGISILTEELLKQNYTDGVNKELSLHYQMFGMEAYALMIHSMQTCNCNVPEIWLQMLEKMTGYVGCSSWRGNVAMEFGDDDEGKILDLQGGEINHLQYIMQLCSLVLKISYQYTFQHPVNETVCWLFTDEEIGDMRRMEPLPVSDACCFKEGGNTFLRDGQDRVLIGIDHAALGFGSIAAHGHADALSFQMMVDGKMLFADPGTYIYHCDLPFRNLFRKTEMHNTLCIDGRNQSEMLGAFLWGRKAKCTLENYSVDNNIVRLEASHDGYAPIRHRRVFEWEHSNLKLRIKDGITKAVPWCATLLLGPDCEAYIDRNTIQIRMGENSCCVNINTPIGLVGIEDVWLSPCYGKKMKTKAIKIRRNSKTLEVELHLFLKDL